MWLIIGVVLLVVWGLAFIAYKVTSAVIHLLLIIAFIMIVFHFLRR